MIDSAIWLLADDIYAAIRLRSTVCAYTSIVVISEIEIVCVEMREPLSRLSLLVGDG
jgi:hypothetical protein